MDETGVVDWDWDDGCCSELSVVVPDTLSGALGWPPSSGDGAILVESVKRREIISGRRRQVRPPPDRGRGSRNCAVPAVLPPGLFPFGNVCISLAPPSCYFAASSTADLALSLTLYQIYIISTHTLHTLACYQLLRAILLLLLGASAAAVRVFFLLFDFGGFFFLNYCATKLLLLVLLLWPRPTSIEKEKIMNFMEPFWGTFTESHTCPCTVVPSNHPAKSLPKQHTHSLGLHELPEQHPSEAHRDLQREIWMTNLRRRRWQLFTSSFSPLETSGSGVVPGTKFRQIPQT